MTNWTADELTRIGDAEEIRIASRRPDGTLRPFITIWAVRSGDAIYVRSAHGRGNDWFQRALGSGTGRIRAGGVEHDVAFEEPSPSVGAAIDRAYHSKYDRYGAAIVGTVVSTEAARSTFRLDPERPPVG